MGQGVKRNAYVRRSGIESRVEDRRTHDEVTSEEINALDAALTQWLRDSGKPKSSKPPAPRHFRRKWQAPVKSSLGVLIIRAQVRAAMDAGLIKRAGGDTAGWADMVHDGESPFARPALL